METLTDKEHKRLIKKFHTLLGKSGIGNDGKEAILSGYEVKSSKDLTIPQLIEVCDAITNHANPKLKDLDRLRKRLMASIGGWLRLMSVTGGSDKIKAIACRAARRDDFNAIPREQLRSLYAAFNKKQKDLRSVESLTAEFIDILSINN